MIEIQVGQEWVEVDPRFSRRVRVLEVRAGDVKSVKIANVGPGLVGHGRATWASKTRFNGKRGGYKLVKEAL